MRSVLLYSDIYISPNGAGSFVMEVLSRKYCNSFCMILYVGTILWTIIRYEWIKNRIFNNCLIFLFPKKILNIITFNLHELIAIIVFLSWLVENVTVNISAKCLLFLHISYFLVSWMLYFVYFHNDMCPIFYCVLNKMESSQLMVFSMRFEKHELMKWL